MKIQGQKESYDVYFHTYKKASNHQFLSEREKQKYKSGITVIRVNAWRRDKIMGGPTTIWESNSVNAQSLELSTEEQRREFFQRYVDKCESRGYEEMPPQVTGEAALILIPIIFLFMLIGGFAYIWTQ